MSKKRTRVSPTHSQGPGRSKAAATKQSDVHENRSTPANPISKTTESRVAIFLSVVAILATLWQAVEANKANKLNDEKLTFEVQTSSFEAVDCSTANLQIRYTYLVLNSSVQPALIKHARWRKSELPHEVALKVAGVHRLDGEVLNEPMEIPAKGYRKLEFIAWAPMTSLGYDRAAKAGLCEPYKSWPPRDYWKVMKELPKLDSIHQLCLNTGWPKGFVPERDLGFEVNIATSVNPKHVVFVPLPSEIACEFEQATGFQYRPPPGASAPIFGN
jgi:hypothetical protein